MPRINLLGILGSLAVLVVGLIVVSVAMCGGEGEQSPLSLDDSGHLPLAGEEEAPTNPNPHPSRGTVGGVRIPVRPATAAELGYTTDPSPPPLDDPSGRSGHLPFAGEEETTRLERELQEARQEAARATAEAERLRQEERSMIVEATPLPTRQSPPPRRTGHLPFAGEEGLTPPMDWEGWEETGSQDIPESPFVLHCGGKPSGYRSRGDETYLHRFTAEGYFLVFIDGRWARATGQVEDLWVDLGTEVGADGREVVRRKKVTFCRAGATAYVRQDPSAPPGEFTLLRFGDNVASARGVSYLGGVTYDGPAHLAPGSVLTCPATDCDKRWRGSETATRYFGWIRRTYTPSPGDVAWAD